MNALPRGLGWLSIAVGSAELFAPRRLAGAIGMERRSGMLQAYGMREIAAGLGLLATRRPASWLWTRVAGDALDLALIAPGVDRSNDRRGAAVTAVAAVTAITALDLYCAIRWTARSLSDRKALVDYVDRSGIPEAATMAKAALRA